MEKYAPNRKNELIISDMISVEEILDVLYDVGVKRLEDVRESLPILLMNGNFCEDEKAYFVELPSCLFEANKITLKKEKYNVLLDFWNKKT